MDEDERERLSQAATERYLQLAAGHAEPKLIASVLDETSSRPLTRHELIALGLERPELSAEEYERRMRQLHEQALLLNQRAEGKR